jgi:hypothetical protein
MQNPSVGRIVRYVLPYKELSESKGIRAAIITRVFNRGVNLQLFLDGPDDAEYAPFVAMVQHSHEHKSGTWHWPPRE